MSDLPADLQVGMDIFMMGNGSKVDVSQRELVLYQRSEPNADALAGISSYIFFERPMCAGRLSHAWGCGCIYWSNQRQRWDFT